MTAPYYDDGLVQLWHGDCREILPTLGRFDCAAIDPPYGETSLAWDRWPDGWPALVAEHTSSMWCFGSMRMFLDRRDEFTGWRMSQDLIWEKPEGGFSPPDRFRRSHEHAVHWYRGTWEATYRQPPRVAHYGQNKGTVHRGEIGPAWNGSRRAHVWQDDGTRAMRSVIRIAHMRYRGTHPTEKPLGILDPLISYACPPGGTVLDCFAGSASTLVAARASGRRAVGVEADERYVEAAARRLDQAELFTTEPAGATP